MKFLNCVFLLLEIIFLIDCSDVQNQEADLINRITNSNNYNKNVRPDPTVSAWITMNIRQISVLDEKNQLMTSSSFIALRWFDDRLMWEPDENNDIDHVTVPVQSIWYPDMMIVNSADTNPFLLITSNNLAIVDYDGYVYVLITAINLRTRCSMNVKYFPFDTQNCPITISSWALDKDKIDLTEKEGEDNRVNNKSYVPNQVWALKEIRVSSSSNYERYPLSDAPIEEINFIFTLERFPLYYMITGIFPCFVLNIVTLVSYALPFASQVGLSMTTLLTFSVYSLRVSGDIPVQSEYLPIIIIYFLCSVIYTLVSLLWFVTSDFMQGRGKMPKCLEVFARGLKKIMCCLFPLEQKFPPKPDEVSKIIVENSYNTNNIIDSEHPDKNLTVLRKRVLDTAPKGSCASVLPLDQNEPKTCLKCIFCRKCKDDEQKEKDEKKYKELFSSHVLALNYFAFSLMFLFMLVSNLVIWITIGNGS